MLGTTRLRPRFALNEHVSAWWGAKLRATPPRPPSNPPLRALFARAASHDGLVGAVAIRISAVVLLCAGAEREGFVLQLRLEAAADALGHLPNALRSRAPLLADRTVSLPRSRLAARFPRTSHHRHPL